MRSGLMLAIDQGTTNTKAILVDGVGAPIFRSALPLTLLYPQAGFVEQDPLTLWQSVLELIHACVKHADGLSRPIEGLAICNQRETALAWTAGPDPKPVANAMSWQCRRSTLICEQLASHADRMRQISGLPLDPLAPAGKWAWLLRHNPSIRESVLSGEVVLGTVDTWLLANLTGGRCHATDHSNASRTALFSLESLHWDDELLQLFDIPAVALPVLQPSASVFGLCSAVEAIAHVPVVAMIGDSHAALVAHGSPVPGCTKATYGTGSSLMMLTPNLPSDTPQLARTIAWTGDGHVDFALEGNIPMTGSALQWVGEFLGLPNPVEDTVALAETVPDAAGVCFVPAMVGLGAPYWDTNARGLIANLHRSHRAAHLARAALDAIAFQVGEVLFSMEKASGATITSLRVDGGATRNDRLLQFQADILGRPVLRALNEELSALGAAWLGAISLGWWTASALQEGLPTPTRQFKPATSAPWRKAQLHAWRVAVERARFTDASEPA